MQLFRLKPDRAEVIVPAADIFLLVASITEATEIIVPTKGARRRHRRLRLPDPVIALSKAYFPTTSVALHAHYSGRVTDVLYI